MINIKIKAVFKLNIDIIGYLIKVMYDFNC